MIFISSVFSALQPSAHPMRYGVVYAPTQQRISAMFAYVVSEGRLFALKASEWSMLLGGVALCGLLTLLFG